MGFLRKRRRAKIIGKPFPAAWEAILRSLFPLWQVLPEADRQELRRHIKIFLAEKDFEGCAGLEITDQMRVLIAAQACVLLLHQGEHVDYYPTVSSILVYPHAYIAKNKGVGPGGVVSDNAGVRLGSVWRNECLAHERVAHL